MQIASSCLANLTPFHFWPPADHFPDLVGRLHVEVRLMGQFGLVAAYHGSAIRMEQFALSVNKTLKA